MRFLSICSGIEAASVAWGSIGWNSVAFSEIEPFPCAVLTHRYPDVPNLGDITRYAEWPDYAVDVVCGGTPCQSFSVAGLRQGVADPRGNLALVYLAIVDRYRPRWIIWENVPGVLSSGNGRDFGSFLGALVKLGYGFAYRVLDAQYVRVDGYDRAVPQRRRRVWVVGCLGDWRGAAAVLSEPESVLGNSPPSRGARAGITAGTIGGAGPRSGWRVGSDEAAAGQLVAHTLSAEGFDASEDGTGRSIPLVTARHWPASVASTLNAHYGDKWGLEDQHINEGGPLFVPIPFDTTQITSAENRSHPRPGDPCHPLAAHAHPPAIAFNDYQDQDVTGIRRLTPIECERLQGFPDGWTDVPFRGRSAADGPRYKAIGNSWPVNVARWIGLRIELVEDVMREIKKTDT